MSVDRRINTRIVACDIAERLSIWEPIGRRTVKNAVDRYGADLVWRLVDDAIALERVSVDASRRRIFFALLYQYQRRKV